MLLRLHALKDLPVILARLVLRGRHTEALRAMRGDTQITDEGSMAAGPLNLPLPA